MSYDVKPTMNAIEVFRLFEIFDKEPHISMRDRERVCDIINATENPVLPPGFRRQWVEEFNDFNTFWTRILSLWNEKSIRLSTEPISDSNLSAEESKLLFAIYNKYVSHLEPRERRWIHHLFYYALRPTKEEFNLRWPDGTALADFRNALHKEILYLWNEAYRRLRSQNHASEADPEGFASGRVLSPKKKITTSNPDNKPSQHPPDYFVDLLDEAKEDFKDGKLPPFVIPKARTTGTRPAAISTKDGLRPVQPTQATLIRQKWDEEDKYSYYTLDINTERVIVKPFKGGSGGSCYRQWMGGNIFRKSPIAYPWPSNNEHALNTLNPVTAHNFDSPVAEQSEVNKRKRKPEHAVQPGSTDDIYSHARKMSPKKREAPSIQAIISKPKRTSRAQRQSLSSRASIASRPLASPGTPASTFSPAPAAASLPRLDERQQQRTWLQIRVGTATWIKSTKLGSCNDLAAFVALICTICGITEGSIFKFEVTCQWMSLDDFGRHVTLTPGDGDAFELLLEEVKGAEVWGRENGLCKIEVTVWQK